MALKWAWRTKTAEFSGAVGTAIAGGLMGSFGNIGGAISTFLFRSDWAPRYVPSFAICCALCATATILVLVEHTWRTKEAAKKAQRAGMGRADSPKEGQVKRWEGWDPEEACNNWKPVLIAGYEDTHSLIIFLCG
ncbi:hypothetical protein M427DRAFT_354834 [Gonapodya prolifera JEL478]|uniref:Major facilitator superfamily (MFS) profile domain-containing protein n=1 Tax=Gonapodya prolifera (strain JEL478) TaxID=1344416 RepID=A0A139ABL4_GONPJ|nr:hypothetical protein M427DRAFT_354834 [Gonapodya prolifera JEL478]|eukprot:KXS14118.1 hypothetical protein M427DRAFT_354834 [Gonapodya prolifera JEL478]